METALSRSMVHRVIESSGGIDVYVIQGETDRDAEHQRVRRRRRFDAIGYFTAAATTALAGILSYALGRYNLADAEANQIMLFLAGVAFVAFRCGTGPAIAASVLSVMVFDYFFVVPLLNFGVSDAQYVVTFGVMLAIGLLVSTLASRLRMQIESGRQRERRSNALYELGKELSSLYGEVFLVSSAARTIGELLTAEIVVYLRPAHGATYAANGIETDIVKHPLSLAAAEWVIEHSQMAGVGTNTLPNACGLFVPLQGSQSCFGCLAVRSLKPHAGLLEPESRRLLESCANQLALSLERDRLTIEAAESRLQAESEQLRSTLLSSVSHDLKTPLAAISGSSSSLLESETIDPATRRALLQSIASEAKRLNRVLENILQMTRLEAGAASPRLQWHVLEEIVGAALNHASQELKNHPVSVDLPPTIPLILVDDVMLEQVLINLLENAAKYTPSGTPIAISASIDNAALRLAIRDRGPGIPIGLEEKIFEKFHRASANADDGKGNGLGLAICRALIKLLGGKITATNPEGVARSLKYAFR